jgi:hypothetical protein
MAINDTTTNRGYQKPNAQNLLIDDVSRLRTALDQIDGDMAGKAGLDSPALTGAPTAPTPGTGENSTRLATTAWVKLLGFLTAGQEAVTSVAGKVGAVLLSVGDVSGAAPINSPAFTGTPTAPTPVSSDNSTRVATTAYVKAQTAASANNFTFGATAPVSPQPGDEWVDSTTGIRYVYINDGNSSAWVETSAPGVGAQGPAGTIAVGTVSTGAAGSSASVTNSGSATAATLNFTIPRGDQGLQGNTGPMGPKSVAIANPTATEKVALFFTTSAQTVSQIRSSVFGSSSPSATFSIRYGTDLSAAGTEVVTGGITTTNTTTGASTTTFNNASIPANSWVWLTTSAISGTVAALNVSVTF